MATQRYDTRGLRFLDALAERGSGPFSSAEAVESAGELGLTRAHAYMLLSRLTASGYLRRLKGGLYALGHRLGSEGSPHSFAIATRLVRPSAISHWSALHYWDLIDQVPMAVTASTPKLVTPPEVRATHPRKGHAAWVIDGSRYEYVKIPHDHMFGIAEEWVDDRTQVPIFDKERALLDAFIHFRGFGRGGLGPQIVRESRDQLDLDKLRAYAKRIGRAAPVKRIESAIQGASEAK